MTENLFINSTYNSIEDFINIIRQDKLILNWDYFHPFFYLMMYKYKICEMGNCYYDNKHKNLISFFKVNKNFNFSQFEIVSIIYSNVDELCGHFSKLLDDNLYLTSEIEFDTDEIILQLNKIKNSNFDNFENLVCRVKLQDSKENMKKISLVYELYLIINNKKEQSDTTTISFVLILKGIAKFQKPKATLPSSKF